MIVTSLNDDPGTAKDTHYFENTLGFLTRVVENPEDEESDLVVLVIEDISFRAIMQIASVDSERVEKAIHDFITAVAETIPDED